MMQRLFILLFCFGVSGLAQAEPISPDSILGLWWSPKKDARIEISKQQGDRYFGKIAWMKPEDIDRVDDKNPDPTHHKDKILGLVILKNFQFEKDRWIDGTIYDPKTGKTYSCKMSLEGPDELKIRGFIGLSIFGRTESFTRFKESQ